MRCRKVWLICVSILVLYISYKFYDRSADLKEKKISRKVPYDAIKKEWGVIKPPKASNKNSSIKFGQQILDSLSKYGQRVAQVFD